MTQKTTSQMLLEEIAVALNDINVANTGSAHFVDLTSGDVTFIMSEHMIDDIDSEELASYRDWEQQSIRTYLEHDLIRIGPVSSYESFQVMEAFTESRPQNEQPGLYVALGKRNPFREFRTVVDRMGLLQEWYQFKNDSELKMAEEWLKDNGLEIENGKIIRMKKYE